MSDKREFGIFLGNLPMDADKDELAEIFQRFGAVASVKVMEGKASSANFGFVNFMEESAVEAALANRHNLSYKGKPIQIKPVTKKSGGGLGGGMNKPYAGGDRSQGSTPRPNIDRLHNNFIQNKPDLVSTVPPKWSPPSMNNSGEVKQEGRWRQNVDIQAKDNVAMYVTHIETPIVFYGQINDSINKQELTEMFQNLHQLCSNSDPISSPPDIDKVYAARFSGDGMWYRCRVLSMKGDHQCEVQYIDYGNKELVRFTELRMIPPKQSFMKPFAVKFSLLGLRCSYDADNMGFVQGVEKLKSLILEKEVKGRVGDLFNPNTHKLMVPVEVDCEGTDINQEILGAKFATRALATAPRGQNIEQSSFSRQNSGSNPEQSGYNRPDHGMLKQRQNESNQWTPNKSRGFKINNEDGSDTWDNAQTSQNTLTSPPTIFDHQPEPTIDTWQPNKVVPVISASPVIPQPMLSQPPPDTSVPPPNIHPPPNTSIPPPIMTMPPPPMINQKAQDDIRQLQNELQNANCEITRLRSEIIKFQKHSSELRYMEKERNDAVIEHAKMKGEIKNLEFQLQATAGQLRDCSLSHRLRSLLVRVDKVKKLRLQFPTERQTRDNIEWAAELLRDQDRISFSDLDIRNKVETVKEAYEMNQDNIKSCTEQTELKALITARDISRQDLHAILLKFDEELTKLPLDSRRQQLQSVLSAIQMTHSNFLLPEINGTTSLPEVLERYAEWKTEKTVSFREKRVMTNTCHNSLNGSLILLQQELALDVPHSGENPLAIANLDDPLNKYTTAVQNEIVITDIENSKDSMIVTMVLKSVVQEIYTELRDIECLIQLRSNYKNHTLQLESWLEEKPSVVDLQEIRKTVKSLKSKLRHKLADKQDLEESDESENDEMRQLEIEINQLRDELQQAFAVEDSHLAKLADLSEHHFPELTLQHPEAGIDNEAVYGGLVKIGRALEYFSIRPVPGCDKHSVTMSTYCGKPIILKEYIMDESLGIRKGEFLRRAMAYNIKHSNIVPIQSIFSIKGKRNTYLQLPYYERSVHDVVAHGCPTPKSLHAILSGVLQGLNSLHEAKLVHGAVHPNNVFIDEQGQGVLAEFDFGKTLQQRSEKEYTAPNGLKFVPPEMTTSQITRASDVYNLGLLALWLMRSQQQIPLKMSGTPDVDQIHVGSAHLTMFIQLTLQEKPASRPSTTDLLNSHYISHIPEIIKDCDSPTLQLRGSKQPSPPLNERTYTGILKNSPSSTPLPSTPPPSLPSLEQMPHITPASDLPSTPDAEVVGIFTPEDVVALIPDVITDMPVIDNDSDDAPPPLEEDGSEEGESPAASMDTCALEASMDTCALEASMDTCALEASMGACALELPSTSALGIPEITVVGASPSLSPLPHDLTKIDDASRMDMNQFDDAPAETETTENKSSI